MELYEIIMKLVGSVQPTGKHDIDEAHLENLKKLTKLTDKLLFEINKVALYSDSDEQSISELGDYANRFISKVKDA